MADFDISPLQRRALRNGGVAALATLIVGFAVVAATSGGARLPPPPAASPSPTPSPPPACTPSWSAVKSENPSEAGNALNDIAALSASEAWAVGSTGGELAPLDTLIQRWDGSEWHAVEAPSPGSERNELFAVDAAGPNDIWAVGRKASGFGDRPLVVRFDGTEWTEVELPSELLGVLNGVAAISETDVWAVGYVGDTAALVERAQVLHFDGETWTNVALGSAVGGGRSLLRDVDAMTSTDVWAVGYRRNQPLIVRFDGVTWSGSPTEVEGVLNAIEGIAPDDAWAVGYPIQRFDGATWSRRGNLRSEAELRALAAVGPSDIWSVGVRRIGETATRAIVLRWDGDNWSSVAGVGIPGSESLTGIDALPDGTALGVGYKDTERGRTTVAIRASTCLAEG